MYGGVVCFAVAAALWCPRHHRGHCGAQVDQQAGGGRRPRHLVLHAPVGPQGSCAEVVGWVCKEHADSSILDRSIYEDAEIFARALHRLDHLDERDLRAYRGVYDEVVRQLPSPSLLVYLRATVPTLMERIRQRSRDIETGITAEYLTLLGSFYDEWMERFDLCPVLTIPSDELDFVNHDAHLTIITNRVLDRLRGKEEVSLQAGAEGQ